MNVNATLIVQAVNFLIAYLLFRFILLKPAYRAITEEEQHKMELEHLVVRDRLSLEEKKHEQREQWLACKHHCEEHMPELLDEAAFFRGITPRATASSLSKSTLDTMRKRMTKTILSLVGVRSDRA